MRYIKEYAISLGVSQKILNFQILIQKTIHGKVLLRN